MTDFLTLLKQKQIGARERKEEVKIVLEGQYKVAYEILLDAYNAGLHACLVGPPGTGKTLLVRKFAQDLGKPFYWVTFTEIVRSSTLIGSFDPVLVFQKGFSAEAFVPGPFLLACIEGGIFFANEINRADEFTLNVMLDALEEKRLFLPQLRTWIRVDDGFYMVAAMNPYEMKGTRKLSEAIRDRIRIWIHLDYPPPELEKKIILANCPEYRIPYQILECIIEIISKLRTHPEIEKPPSIRASIALARFIGERAKRKGEITFEDVVEAAKYVLLDTIDVRAGTDPKSVVNSVLRELGLGEIP